MRSILNAYSPLTIIIVVVGGTVVLALLALLALRRLSPNLGGGHFEDIADGLRTVYELVFALVLAFVISSVLDNYSHAESRVAGEAANLSHLRRAMLAFPVEEQIPLDQALSQYIHAIADEEWDTMKQGRGSPRASAALDTLYAAYQAYSPPAEGSQAQFYRESTERLNEIGSARRDRLDLSATELPFLLRVFLPVGAVLLLVLEYRPKMARPAQLVHMGLLAGVVSFACLLTVLLDYPFSGQVSVSNAAFKSGALAEYWATTQPHVVRPGETVEKLSPEKLQGVWNSDAFGVIVFREVDGGVHAVYRVGQGTFVGDVDPDGVLRGWWCDAPTRQPPDDAGDVEWMLVRSGDDETAFGNWRYGSEEPFKGGWDLKKIGGPEPPDISPRFDDAEQFCPHP